MSSIAVFAAAVLLATAGSAPGRAAADTADAGGPGFESADRPEIAADYQLGKEDVLDFDVLNFEQLTGTLTVRPDGKISVKLVGDVLAEGRTIADVRTEITRRMKPFVPDPHVSLTVKQINSLKVYVMGRVTAPGMFNVGANVNMLQALAMAKGFTPWAKKSKLVIVRGASGKRIKVDYDHVVAGKEDNYLLYPGDTLVVP
jgi:polysaccharide export outer membrane protein